MTLTRAAEVGEPAKVVQGDAEHIGLVTAAGFDPSRGNWVQLDCTVHETTCEVRELIATPYVVHQPPEF